MITPQHAQSNVKSFRTNKQAKEVHTIGSLLSDRVNQKSALGFYSVTETVEYFDKANFKTVIDSIKDQGYTVDYQEFKDNSKAGFVASVTLSWE